MEGWVDLGGGYTSRQFTRQRQSTTSDKNGNTATGIQTHNRKSLVQYLTTTPLSHCNALQICVHTHIFKTLPAKLLSKHEKCCTDISSYKKNVWIFIQLTALQM